MLFDLLGRFRFEFGLLAVALSLLSASGRCTAPSSGQVDLRCGRQKDHFRKFMIFVFSYLALGIFINIASAATSLWSKSLENRLLTTMSRQMLEAYYQKEYSSVLRNGHGYFINRVYGDLREGLIPLLTLVQTTIKQASFCSHFCWSLSICHGRRFSFWLQSFPSPRRLAFFWARESRRLTSQEREQEGAVLANSEQGAQRVSNGQDLQLVIPTVDAVDRRLEACLSTGYQRYRLTRIFRV